MQSDLSNPPTGAQRYDSSGQGEQGSTVTDYTSRAVESAGQAIGSVAGSIADQIQARPLAAASIFLAIVGSIIGNRIAQMRMQRHRTPLQRAQDALGSIGSTVAATFSRRTAGPMDTLRDRGELLSTTAMGIRGSLMQRMPGYAAPRGRFGAAQDTIKQIGYAVSLIPMTMALLRNPIVRDLSVRMVSRRIRRH